MKFSTTSIVAILGLTSQVLCAPAPVPEPAAGSLSVIRATSVIDTVNQVLSSVTTAVNADLAAITQLINTAGNSVAAQLTIVVALQANLNDIVNQAAIAATAILQSTTNLVADLTQDEINALAETVYNLANFTLAVQAALIADQNALFLATKTLLISELTAVNNAIPTIIIPLASFVQTIIQNNLVGPSATTSVLTGALSSVLSSLNSLLQGLGINLG